MLKKLCPSISNDCTASMVGLKWFWAIPLLFALDQLSKYWVLTHVTMGEIFQLCPSLNIILAHNSGVAFSLFASKPAWGQMVLLALIILICTFVAIWLAKTPTKEKYNGIALSLILGGALGNLSDRIWHGYVIDFIDFYINTWHWYTFNLADTFITMGALMMAKTVIFSKE
ncbi:MAG: signal peptidase II [Candidatus Berkiella sp.]